MAAPRTAALLLLLLFLLAAALLASSCYASASPPHVTTAGGGETPEEEKKAAGAAATTMGRITDPKCSEMVRCTPAQCTDYCNLIGLVRTKAFCTFHGLQFYCCCSVPFRRAAETPTTISS